MKNRHPITILLLSYVLISTLSMADTINPNQDIKEMKDYFKATYPSMLIKDYSATQHPFNRKAKEPFHHTKKNVHLYANALEVGKAIWHKTFQNGKTFIDCFPGKSVKNIRTAYPFFDNLRTEVITLELALNECLEGNGEQPFAWKQGKMAQLSAYLNRQAEGERIQPKIESVTAKQAYQAGKHFFFGKRGKLNLACADCHVYSSGLKAGSDTFSSAIGQISHFPVYSKKWQSLGTLHRRYIDCQINTHAQSFKAQSVEYRNLEYFHTYMSKGLKWNGPQI